MSVTTFNAKAPGIMRKLMADFGLDAESAAAILGNLGHESGGLSQLQELRPTISGSRGGYGWAQWTGPRRREFETYCSRNHLVPSSDTANYGFLFVELKGAYASAIRAVRNANGLAAKVRAFELAFERAGIKHYDSREIWAKRALTAYKAAPKLSTPTKTVIVVTTTGGTAAAEAARRGVDPVTIIAIVVATIALAAVAYFLVKRWAAPVHEIQDPPPVVEPVEPSQETPQ